MPPLRDFYFTPHRASALGLEDVARRLEAQGYAVRRHIFPLTAGGRRRGSGAPQPLPAGLSHLQPHLIPGEWGPTSFFTTYQRFGPDFASAAATILIDGPELICIGCFAYCYAEDTLELARAVRKAWTDRATAGQQIPDATTPRPAHRTRPRIIVGGAGVSARPEYFRAEPAIDEVVVGEPAPSESGAGTPQSWPEAIAPAPVFTTRMGRRGSEVTIGLTRGCPRRCAFCSVHIAHGEELRCATLEDALRAVECFPADTASINFEDDNLLACGDYWFEILARIRQRFPQAAVLAENGLDYQLLTPEKVRHLAGLGLRALNLSIAGTDRALLRAQRRGFDQERYEAVVASAVEGGLGVTTYLICGLPGDSIGTTARALTYLTTVSTRIGISLFYPVPGLPGFENGSGRWEGVPPYLAAGSSAWPWTGALTTTQLITAFRLARFLNARRELRTADLPAGHATRLLIERILTTRRLHTFVGRGARLRLHEVPLQDEELVAQVLETAAAPTGA